MNRNSPEFKVRAKEYRRRWRERNPDKVSAINRRTKYGISQEQYQAALDRQGGKCYSCPSTEGLCVDHCHETGRFRGLLCGPCNRALGLLKDDPIRLRRLIQYLKEIDDGKGSQG